MELNDVLPSDHRSGFVAVVGRPNVGKSTLVNALLGEKVAIVSPKPQTTRNRLLGILTREDAQVIFVDTPGIHRPMHRLGELLLETAAATLPDADLAVWVVDVTGRPNDEDRQVAALLAQTAGALPVILALNQADRLLPQYVQENTAAYTALAPGAESLLVSAKRSDNLDALLAKIIATLPPGPRYYPEDQFTDQQVRFMAAELVREQALLRLHDEVPHGIAVAVNEFKERNVPGASEVPGTSPAAMTYISATIYVEREAHKPILLGKGGEMLKAIGQGARREIETLLDTRVYLDLWVKVRPKWRTDEDELRRLGYESPVVKPRKGGERRQKRRTTR